MFIAPEDDLIAAPTVAPAKTGGFEAPPDEVDGSDNYWGDVGKNAKQGLSDFTDSINAKKGLEDVKTKLDTGYDSDDLPNPVTEWGKSAKGMAQGLWQGVKDTGSAIKAPFEMIGGESLAQTDIGQKFRERPLSVPVGVAGTVVPAVSALRGIRSGAGAVEGIAKASGKTALTDLPEVITGAKAGPPHAVFAYTDNFGPGGAAREVYNVFGDPKDPVFAKTGWGSSIPVEDIEKLGIPITGRASGAKIPKSADPLQAVNDFVKEKFGKAEQTSGFKQNLGKSFVQKSKGMNLKEIGANPGQIRKLKERFGEPMVEGLADLAEEKGITKGFFNFQTGNAIKELDKTSGANIGAVRRIAKERGAAHNPDELLAKIRSELDPIYMKGTGSSQKGTYLKALEDIKNSGADVESLANTISDKNAFIAKNKLTLPLGPTKEVMKIANRLNNEKINTVLNPQEQALLQESLKDFSAAKVFDKMYGFTYGRTMGGRTGPGGFWNTVKDVGGRKVMQKLYKNVGEGLQKTPDKYKFKDVKSLSADVLDAIDEALDEVIDQMGSNPPGQGMAYGGIVPEVNDFLSQKYGKK